MSSAQGIFVSDLDGTLLQNGALEQTDVEAWRTLADHNILRVIATGRSLHSFQHCLPGNFPLDYAILSTGNMVLDWKSGEIVFASRISAGEAQGVADLLVDLDISFMLHDDLPDTHRFRYHCGGSPAPDFQRRLATHAAHGRPWTGSSITKSISQFLAIVENGESHLADQIQKTLPQHSVIRATSPLDDRSVWVEIFAAEVSKSWGIRRILEHIGRPELPVAAIGNDYNDKDMLDFADISFRVHDAFLEADPAYITTPGLQGAVAHAAEQFSQYLSAKMKRT